MIYTLAEHRAEQLDVRKHGLCFSDHALKVRR